MKYRDKQPSKRSAGLNNYDEIRYNIAKDWFDDRKRISGFITAYRPTEDNWEPDLKTRGARKMTCFMCKGEMEDKLTTFMVDLGNCIVIVKNVPSHVCRQCGEVSYSDEVSARLEEIVDAVKKAPVEISISNYAA